MALVFSMTRVMRCAALDCKDSLVLSSDCRYGSSCEDDSGAASAGHSGLIALKALIHFSFTLIIILSVQKIPLIHNDIIVNCNDDLNRKNSVGCTCCFGRPN